MRPKGREKTKRPGRFRASKVWDLNPRIIGQLHDAFSTKALWRGFCQQSNFAFKEIYYTDRSMMVTAGVTIVADTAEAIKSPVKCDFVSCLIVKVSVHIRGYGDPYSIYIYIYIRKRLRQSRGKQMYLGSDTQAYRGIKDDLWAMELPSIQGFMRFLCRRPLGNPHSPLCTFRRHPRPLMSPV